MAITNKLQVLQPVYKPIHMDAHYYIALAENIYNITQDIKPLLNTIENGHRPYVFEDFTKAMLPITREILTTIRVEDVPYSEFAIAVS